jgi:hypothetical protein
MFMKYLVLTIEVPEDYDDVHPDIMLGDMRISAEWNIINVEVKNDPPVSMPLG